jgi:hypothetical protein
MSNVITASQTGVGRSNFVSLDDFQNPFSVGLIATVTGTVTFNIEYTMSDPFSLPVNSMVWAVAPNFSALTATTGGSLTIPCKGITINVTAGTGTVSLQADQSGPNN